MRLDHYANNWVLYSWSWLISLLINYNPDHLKFSLVLLFIMKQYKHCARGKEGCWWMCSGKKVVSTDELTSTHIPSVYVYGCIIFSWWWILLSFIVEMFCELICLCKSGCKSILRKKMRWMAFDARIWTVFTHRLFTIVAARYGKGPRDRWSQIAIRNVSSVIFGVVTKTNYSDTKHQNIRATIYSISHWDMTNNVQNIFEGSLVLL